MWLQFARVKAMEMENSMQLTTASDGSEPAAKRSKQDIPEVRCSQFFWLVQSKSNVKAVYFVDE